MDMKAIGKRIKTARESAGLTQEELSEIINCSPQHISVIERGIKTPRLDTFVAIAKATHTSADFLLGTVLDQQGMIPADGLASAIAALPMDMQIRMYKVIEILSK